MTRDEYIARLLETYAPVSVLSEKNDCKVLRLRKRELQKDLILRSFPSHLEAYEALCNIRCENLPEIYDAIDLADG